MFSLFTQKVKGLKSMRKYAEDQKYPRNYGIEEKEVHVCCSPQVSKRYVMGEKKEHKSCVCQFRVFSGPATTRYFCVRSQLRFLPCRGIQLDRAAVCYFSSHHCYYYCCCCCCCCCCYPLLHRPFSVFSRGERYFWPKLFLLFSIEIYEAHIQRVM